MKMFKNLRFKENSLPLAFLLLCIASFGLLIPKLGFYWDDWETILLIQQGDMGRFWDYFSGTRPLAAWTYILFGPLLGTNALLWHSFTLVLRCLSVLFMWKAFCALWPEHKQKIAYAAFLFAVYPLFSQQPIAVAYHQHWIGYMLYFISVWAMLSAIRNKHHFWVYLATGIFTLILNLAIFEYFTGVELLRPVLLWVLFGNLKIPIKERIQKTIWAWLPYLLTLIIFIIFRISYSFQSPESVDQPTLLYNFLSQPLQATRQLIQFILQDWVHITITGWYRTLEPALIDLQTPSLLISWGIAILCTGVLAFFLYRLQFQETESNLPEQNYQWISQAAVIGILAALLGALPGWITSRQVTTGLYGDRLGMVSMFGASLFIVAALEWFSNKPLQKIIFLSLLIGLASGYHFRNANNFRWSWETQKRIYWQLYWRAPAIEPGTAFLSTSDLTSYVRPSYAINLLYNQPQQPGQFAYAFYLFGKNITDETNVLLNGTTFKETFRGDFHFESNSLNSLVLYYDPPTTGCLWILSDKDQDTPYFLPATTRDALPLSQLNRIQLEPVSTDYPAKGIFGNEPAHDWCYYFEKAELHHQYEEWEKVVALGNEAMQKGYLPATTNSPHEWKAFVEAYAYLGNWEQAKKISISAVERDIRYRPTYCQMWVKILSGTTSTNERDRNADEVFQGMQCN